MESQPVSNSKFMKKISTMLYRGVESDKKRVGNTGYTGVEGPYHPWPSRNLCLGVGKLC